MVESLPSKTDDGSLVVTLTWFVPFCILCSCVPPLGEKEDSLLPVSRSCSAEIPPPLNLASSSITAYPEIITEAPSPKKLTSELTGSQTEAGSGGRRTSDLTTLLEVTSPPSFPGHRHSKSMDGKTSFKWENVTTRKKEREREEKAWQRLQSPCFLAFTSSHFVFLSGLIRLFIWLR